MTSAFDAAVPTREPAASPKADAPADTRCRIVVAAERMFREIGYRKTTVADIAKALRMSPANVYRFFDSKKAINESVAERLIGEVEAELEAIAAEPGVSAADRLRRLIEGSHRLSVERYTVNRRMHEMVEAAMVESWDVVHRHIVRAEALFSRVVAEGVAAGEFHVADPVVAARCVQAAILRFCHPAMIVQCAEEIGPTVQEMCEFILASLRAEKPGPGGDP